MRGRYNLLIILLIFFVMMGVACSNKEYKNQELGDETDQADADSGSYWPTESWKEAIPESVGMDPTLLSEMFQHIEEENIPMEGFVVVKDGYIVAEKYGGDYTVETPHPIYSVTKSVTSALVGISIKKGIINSVEDNVFDYLDPSKIDNMDDWKKDISIKQLLTMQSGLDFPEQTKENFYDSSTWKEFMEGSDPTYFLLNLPVRDNPGTWNYSTGDARVISRIIQEASDRSLSEYAQEHLFKPLGIQADDVEWPSDRSGTSFGGTGVLMKPRDIAKIGYLYLQDGVWDGEQLFPEGWVEESTKPHSDTGGNFDGDKYGYFFWLKKINGYNTYRGMGLYGQYMVIVPDLNLVVVQTSSGMDVDPLLEEYIIPSIQK